MNDKELINLLMLNRITNYTPREKFDLLEKFGSSSEIFSRKKSSGQISEKPFMINGQPFELEKIKHSAEQELEYCQKKGINIIGFKSSKYPVRLKYIFDPPVVLYTRGNQHLLNGKHPVGMVGSRKASNMSINIAYSVARALSKAGVQVVSGLAAGVDYYAHKGALEGEGSTTAVLGNGIDVVYPRENSNMYQKISEKGLLVSEFPLRTPPFKWNFPRRNRIISGLSLGVVVVEASRSSGALITAMHALEHSREVMAFPGIAASDSFAGNNNLIKQGAYLVENAQDILSILGIPFESGKDSSKLLYEPLEYEILRIIGDGKVSIEEIEKMMDSPVSRVVATLMSLEVKGVVIQHPGKYFSRVVKYGE